MKVNDWFKGCKNNLNEKMLVFWGQTDQGCGIYKSWYKRDLDNWIYKLVHFTPHMG